MPSAPKKPRKVLKAFRDKAGRDWQPGQNYEAPDADEQAEAGNVEAAPEE
jgi:hypothetical protein